MKNIMWDIQPKSLLSISLDYVARNVAAYSSMLSVLPEELQSSIEEQERMLQRLGRHDIFSSFHAPRTDAISG